jgi:S-disulfanyl-L-cysteine oxidoreductase SoxD
MRIGILALLVPAAFSQTVLDGAYTAAQATRGESAYQMNCGGCHGETLDGRAMGPLRGDKFLDRWREESLAPLFDHIRTRMPASAAGSLSTATYLDILAYILQVNQYPAGKQELTPESVAHFKLVGQDGPKPLPSNTLVAVIGCFSRANDEWEVSRATQPVRTRNADEISAEERTRAATLPLGALEFQLSNLDELPAGFKPEALNGHKVEAKGVLLRRTGKDRINVLTLEGVASDCK